MFDYETKTRSYYKNDDVARNYHESYTQLKGVKGFRFRYIAEREKRAVLKLLSKVKARRVIDIPTGTGKMASVLKVKGCEVMACDVSENMLRRAKVSYSEVGLNEAAFKIVDLQHAQRAIKESYDVTLCIRLMHRVPNNIKKNMLEQIGKLSPYAIISFGIDNYYQAVRRMMRQLTFGGDEVGIETRPAKTEVESIIEDWFEIIDRCPVSRGVSSEWIYLLRARNWGVSDVRVSDGNS
jgi:SAM-dependent methyltransferase